MLLQYIWLLALLTAGALVSIWTGKLTTVAGITGMLLGLVIFIGTGWLGLLLMAFFFLLGTLATAWKRNKKEAWKIAERNKGRRNASQVLANGGMAGILAMLAIILPEKADLFTLLIAGVFSSATADTLSSELGSLYGSRFYNIISFRKDTRGLDGVISVEGTLIGMAGSFLVALVTSVGYGWDVYILWIVIAGTFGNLTDSVLGATMERRGLIPNDMVNFFNTLVGALVMFLLLKIQ
ncbi:MAG TPA: DUF92 domain-containing protein [Flavisolibacter sp.]|nr:DUF92 domain-containing protein [Flavisolibacter sp.]